MRLSNDVGKWSRQASGDVLREEMTYTVTLAIFPAWKAPIPFKILDAASRRPKRPSRSGEEFPAAGCLGQRCRQSPASAAPVATAPRTWTR